MIKILEKWKYVKTLYGICKETNPSRFPEVKKDGPAYKPTSISLLLTYDLTNWSPGGWAHYLEGYTIYLSNSNDSAFSPVNGILLSDIAGGVPARA